LIVHKFNFNYKLLCFNYLRKIGEKYNFFYSLKISFKTLAEFSNVAHTHFIGDEQKNNIPIYLFFGGQNIFMYHFG